MNPPIISPMTSSERRGRGFFLASLVVTAAFVMNGFIKSLASGTSAVPGDIVSNATILLILVLAFRGGQLSLRMAKGCAVLFAIIIAIVILVIAGSFVRGIPLPQPPTATNTLPFIAMVAGTLFSIWALFISVDVKAFLAYQREAAHQKQLHQIKQKSLSERST